MVTVVIPEQEGTVDHTFTSEELKCDTGTVSPGTKTSVTFKMPDAPVDFVCTPHADKMKGQLVPT